MDYHKLLPFFLALFIFTSCKQEPKESLFDKNNLIGKWELTDAWRNSKRTETLTGTYYEFKTDDTMVTNLTPDLSEGHFDFEFDGKTILQKGEPEITYSLDTLTQSTLIFSMNINNFPFKLALTKTIENDSIHKEM